MAILDDGRSIDDRSTEKQSEKSLPLSMAVRPTTTTTSLLSYFCACPISTFLCLLSASHRNNGLAGNFMG
ncbi:hypothetical protein IC575_027907 [Cucumis melo]